MVSMALASMTLKHCPFSKKGTCISWSHFGHNIVRCRTKTKRNWTIVEMCVRVNRVSERFLRTIRHDQARLSFELRLEQTKLGQKSLWFFGHELLGFRDQFILHSSSENQARKDQCETIYKKSTDYKMLSCWQRSKKEYDTFSAIFQLLPHKYLPFTWTGKRSFSSAEIKPTFSVTLHMELNSVVFPPNKLKTASLAGKKTKPPPFQRFACTNSPKN